MKRSMTFCAYMTMENFGLTDEDIKEFIQLYKLEFGEELSRKDATEMAEHLLELYCLLATPLPIGTNSVGEPKEIGRSNPAPEAPSNKDKKGSNPALSPRFVDSIRGTKKPEM